MVIPKFKAAKALKEAVR